MTRASYDRRMNDGYPTLDDARQLAISLHGPEYFLHLDRVSGYLSEFLTLLPGGSVSPEDAHAALQAALLHDSVEDGFTTYARLRELGYPERVVSLVAGMTRDPSLGTYHEKMVETAGSGDVLLICCKLADNMDNSSGWRIEQLPEERRSIIRRYRRARRTLFEGLKPLLRADGATEAELARIEAWLGRFDPHAW